MIHPLCLLVPLGLIAADPAPASGSRDALPTVALREAPLLRFPANTDSNSPAHWSGSTFHLFVSAGSPRRAAGPDLFHLGPAVPSKYDTEAKGGRWIECTWKEGDGADGPLWAWYHFEPAGLVPGSPLTAPRIGAVVSRDDGATFHDLGLVLESRPGTLRPEAKNGFFLGGNGDFSALLDRKGEWLYLFFSAYAGDLPEQGVGVARMAWSDRAAPAGKVRKWHRGAWEEPGVGGRLTPIFPARRDWVLEDPDAFWGPSIHWNTHLERYVILLNRTKDRPPGGPAWRQEGIYISFNDDLSRPEAWSPPVKVFDGGRWYPQVIGIDAARRETDKLVGRVGRFSMRGEDDVGESRWEMVFLRPGEKP